ncbi:MAG: TetR/AcrR family transcriptional regulator [Acidimicrobiales bacterium]|jgi:AcrR family transcriptional regulator
MVTETQAETASGSDRPRRPRSDSVLNRARILQAAEQAFGSEGLAVPIDEIAERAGVGVGTIYRHFPTKEALFEAIVLSHFERLVQLAQSLTTAEDPVAALFSFLAQLVNEGVDKRNLADALAGAGIDVKAAAGTLKQDLEEAVGQLLTRAQADGSIRSDISIADLMGLVAGTCMTAERFGGTEGSACRMLSVVCDGLRTPD